MSIKRVVTVLLVAAALLGAFVAAPVVLIELDDGYTIPPASVAPELPEGVMVIEDSRECGSGGCWRVLTLRGPRDQSLSELVSSLGIPLGESLCRAPSLLDRRQVCITVNTGPRGVIMSLQYRRHLDS